jgi:hypothetical protein
MTNKLLPELPSLDKRQEPQPWALWPLGAFPVADQPAELVRAELVNAPVTLTRMQLCDPTPPAKEEQDDEGGTDG